MVADVALADLDGDARLELIVCDMRHGMVLLGRPYDPAAGLTLIAQVPHPSRAQVVDLDGDGVRDVLVADLGEFLPRDHDKGAVVWLRGLGGGRFAPFAIGGLPRIASVEAADLDADGDKDLVVAAFGYRKTGSVLVLENRTADWARPAFSPVTLDARPGAVRALSTDINHDGRLDVVAVVSQEHEEVMAYVRGNGLSFTPTVIWKAPHANWGSSGLSMADLDADGDLDLLLANGDTFDDSLLKPYHGLAWLERRTSALAPDAFVLHRLADLPGPHGMVATDPRRRRRPRHRGLGAGRRRRRPGRRAPAGRRVARADGATTLRATHPETRHASPRRARRRRLRRRWGCRRGHGEYGDDRGLSSPGWTCGRTADGDATSPSDE